jgi:ornithine decarboxylase
LPYCDVKNIDKYIESLIKCNDLKNNFYICDIGQVKRFYDSWCKEMPRVIPFYAVKCLLNSAVVANLANLGSGFDCASAYEIEQIVDLGVSPDRIIYANPCKQLVDLDFASKTKIQVSTFDSVSELDKIMDNYPSLRLLIRLRVDDPDARCNLGGKFGSEPILWEGLMNAARDRKTDVIGVSFHIGSSYSSAEAFNRAIACARIVFNIGTSRGFNMHLIDIGGGFTASFYKSGNMNFTKTANAISRALNQFFPKSGLYNIIAEPGRYMVEKTCILLTQIFGQRIKSYPDGQKEIQYWITDGLYGSMNCLIYDHATLKPYLLRGVEKDEKIFQSTLFGPTCDGLDTVVRNMMLPNISNGNWIGFRDMGAYTIVGATDFNGIKVSSTMFC